MTYQPGSHIIASLSSNAPAKLNTFELFKIEVDRVVSQYNLENLGEVYHNFSPAGFTAVICLSESHISVHTWPEHNKVNLDIYLSNYLRTNDNTVKNIYEDFLKHFEAVADKVQTLSR